MQVFDASSMINAWDKYPILQFPGLWEWISVQIREKKLVMSRVAYTEVADMAPDCGKWLKTNALEILGISDVVIQGAMRIKGLLSIANDNYHAKGVGENDILIIATARAYGYELISDEERQPILPTEIRRRKIPAVCNMDEVAVRCISFIEHIKRSGEIFR